MYTIGSADGCPPSNPPGAPSSSSADALTLDQLRLFLAVVDAGGFSAAARSLRRAQSAVSYGVANLERQLGTSLFERSGRKPKLTQAGDELAAEARAVCSQVDRLRARAHGIAHGVEPRLAIAVDHMFPLARARARAAASSAIATRPSRSPSTPRRSAPSPSW